MNFPNLRHTIQKIVENGIRFHIIESKISDIVTRKMDQHKNACVLCSRLRRGLLYSYAREHGFNKIALGHNADDIIETLLLNLFYNGKIKGMSPRFVNDDGDLIVIRPLFYVFEKEIKELSRIVNFPIIKNSCPLIKFRGKKREEIKILLDNLEKDFPAVRNNILMAMEKIEKRYLPP